MSDGTSGNPWDRLRRSVHFVPGGQRKLLDKTLASAADCVILDLEDSVTPERKEAARRDAASWLAEVDFGGKERAVRMNALDAQGPGGAPSWEADLEATMAAPPDLYVVPKVNGPEDLERISRRLDELEARAGVAPGSVGLLPIATETAAGLLAPLYPNTLAAGATVASTAAAATTITSLPADGSLNTCSDT